MSKTKNGIVFYTVIEDGKAKLFVNNTYITEVPEADEKRLINAAIEVLAN